MSVDHAKKLDTKNGDTLCQDVISKEMYQVLLAFKILEEGDGQS